MKYAVIMIVHNNPLQVQRLCKTLENPNCYFFIHVDKKSNIEEFEIALKDIKNVKIVSKHKVYWGDISLVDATITLLQEAIDSNMDYIFSISGQDYLIKNDNNLMNYVNIDKNYLEYHKLPYYNWGEDGRCDRYKYYHNLINSSNLFTFDPRGRIYKRINKCFVKLQKALKIERKILNNYTPYSGSNWFNINRECAKYVIDTYRMNRRYFKYVFIPDEMFIQIIVLNSNFKKNTINDTLRYIDWVTGPEEPRTLTVDDYNKIINSNAIFARKFDEKKDKKILDKLDQNRK